jgi:hypothetical protein
MGRLIGNSDNDHNKGAASVFTRSGETWTQGAELKARGEVGKGFFGFSVALSAEGDIALISALNDNGGAGAVWLFTRSGETWTQD